MKTLLIKSTTYTKSLIQFQSAPNAGRDNSFHEHSERKYLKKFTL